MKINGCDFNLEKAAREIGTAYAMKSLEAGSDFVFDAGEVDNMLQVYVNSYLSIISKSQEAIESLVR